MIEFRFNIPLDNEIGSFGDVLPSKSLIMVLKKLNLTQHKQTCASRSKDTIIKLKLGMFASSYEAHKCRKSKNKIKLASCGTDGRLYTTDVSAKFKVM